MSGGRPREHELLRDAMFRYWVPWVAGELRDAGGYPQDTVEYVLQRYGGEPPDPGFPPDWPPEAYVIEREVVRLPRELRDVVLLEFGAVRDREGHRYRLPERCKVLHVSRGTYYQRVYAAQAALWQCQQIRELCGQLA